MARRAPRSESLGCRRQGGPCWKQLVAQPARTVWDPAARPDPPPRPRRAPVGQLLGDEQVAQVVLGRALVVLQQRVRVAQAVAGLRLHRLVLELPGQLQCLPAGRERQPPGGGLPAPPFLGAPI